MTEITSKASRFEMRLTPSQKERLDRAAEFRGLSTSQWALTNLLAAADEAAWRPLWDGYRQFYRSPASDAVTATTWARLLAWQALRK